MNKKLPLNYIKNTLLALLFLVNSFAFSQDFDRIEDVIGLSVLRDNNGVAVADIDRDNDLDVFVVAKARDENGIEDKNASRRVEFNIEKIME